MSLSYYVYYRVESGTEADGRARVRELLARVERGAGVRGRWLRKRDEPLLWMEVYEAVTDAAAFEAALSHACEASGIEAVLAPGSQRKVERFVACA